jgi:beta-mannosidase
MHYWSVWHEGRGFEAYREVTPRFCSEFGFQSFPSLREIKTYTPQDQLNITSPVMESHQRNDRGNTIIISTISRYFRFPSSFEHIIYLSQVQQAMAIATAVTFWRSRRPVCMGTLYWQLNDTWPGASWSSIEYGGAWKLLHYAAKRFYAPSILSLIPTPDGNQLEVYGINDTPHPVSGRLQIERISFSGQRNTIYSSEAFAAESSSTLLTRIDMADVGVSRTEELLKVSLLDMESVHLLAAPKSCMLQKAHITVKKGGQSSLVLETDKPALFVQIGISGWDGRFSDNGFHLLPGTGKEISCREGELPENWHDRLSITSVRDTY